VSVDDVVAQFDEAGLRLLRFLWCGNDGTVRAKASGRHGLEGRLRTGIGLTVAMQAISALDQLQPVPALGPVGEMVPASPQAETNASETIADTTRVAILEFTETSSGVGGKFALKPRGTQRDSIHAAAERRLIVRSHVSAGRTSSLERGWRRC